MKTNATGALCLAASIRLGWVDNGHVLGTTTLGVFNSASSRVARGGLLAGSSAGHAIVEFDIAVELNADLNFGD